MAYVVVVVLAWLVLVAATSLRPGRRGVLAAFAYPLGWAAGELPAQAIVAVAAALGVLRWWGWPRTPWLGPVVLVLAVLATLENLALIGVQFAARTVVRRALAGAPRRPLIVGRAGQDAVGSWWRTALQIPFHPRHLQLARDVAYGDHPRQVLDVWRTPRTPTGAPVIVYFHGGAWTFGDKREQGRPMLHEFVARGWVVVTSNYRLAPDSPWPAHIVDATRVLGFVKRHIANYGGDPDRVVLAGGSAGGHLAALLALARPGEWADPDLADVTDWSVRGCVSLYGVLEMTGDETHWHGLGHGLRALLEHRVVQQPYLGHEDLYESISPLHRISTTSPPFLVVQGGNDTLVDVNVARDFVSRFADRALAPVYYVELPLTQHAFDHTASPRTSATIRGVVAFAESVVATRPPLDAALWAAYQSPPVEILVDVDDAWLPATEVARELGTLFVVSADNPFSRRESVDNEARRRELDDVVARQGWVAHHAIGRDPRGDWPEEHGVALVGARVVVSRSLIHL